MNTPYDDRCARLQREPDFYFGPRRLAEVYPHLSYAYPVVLLVTLEMCALMLAYVGSYLGILPAVYAVTSLFLQSRRHCRRCRLPCFGRVSATIWVTSEQDAFEFCPRHAPAMVDDLVRWGTDLSDPWQVDDAVREHLGLLVSDSPERTAALERKTRLAALRRAVTR